MRIFVCLVYIHVSKEKRTKLEPSKKKGTFVGYIIYVLGQTYVEISWDVTFDDDYAFWKSKGSHLDTDDEEHEAPKEVGSEPME